MWRFSFPPPTIKCERSGASPWYVLLLLFLYIQSGVAGFELRLVFLLGGLPTKTKEPSLPYCFTYKRRNEGFIPFTKNICTETNATNSSEIWTLYYDFTFQVENHYATYTSMLHYRKTIFSSFFFFVNCQTWYIFVYYLEDRQEKRQHSFTY